MTEKIRKRPPTSGSLKKGFDPRRNLTGRPKLGLTLAEKIRDAMNEPVHEGYTKLDALIDMAMEQAASGNPSMLEMLWSRGYGRVPERIELQQEEKLDLSKLSSEELAALKELRKKASGDAS